MGDPYLPRGGELSEHLAALNDFPSDDARDRGDLAKVAAYGQEVLGREWLRVVLRDIFDRSYPPCSIHNYLASLEPNLLILTTNYDDLTEQAFHDAGRPFHVVVHPIDRAEWSASVLWWRPGARTPVMEAPNNLRLIPGQETIIYKIHGTVHRPRPSGEGAMADVDESSSPPPQFEVNGAEACQGEGAPGLAATATVPSTDEEWDSFLITEDDYVEFLSRMTMAPVIPSTFVQHFNRSQFLFLGYGLNDWNLRVVLRNLMLTRRGPSWAVQFNPSRLEERLWQAREVDIYDLSIDAFVQGLFNAQARNDGGRS
ncbi:MAG TPA: SIR2 family protein [Longimicrobium sp.]|nr:SIR2 family protein [Longimicrobium sp.]